jgi:hypothetical protein
MFAPQIDRGRNPKIRQSALDLQSKLQLRELFHPRRNDRDFPVDEPA